MDDIIFWKISDMSLKMNVYVCVMSHVTCDAMYIISVFLGIEGVFFRIGVFHIILCLYIMLGTTRDPVKNSSLEISFPCNYYHLYYCCRVTRGHAVYQH